MESQEFLYSYLPFIKKAKRTPKCTQMFLINFIDQ